jgi:hypothetical protein
MLNILNSKLYLRFSCQFSNYPTQIQLHDVNDRRRSNLNDSEPENNDECSKRIDLFTTIFFSFFNLYHQINQHRT